MQIISKKGLGSCMVWWVLLEAIPETLSAEDKTKIFEEGDDVEVVFQMNGVDLDLKQVVDHWQRQIAQQVAESAKALIENKFYDVIELIGDLSETIKDRIGKDSSNG